MDRARELVCRRIDELSVELRDKINRVLHANPETAHKEFVAHDTLTGYLEQLGFGVTRRAHGLETSFEAGAGSWGRQVVVCCEYDALPRIGHACGHNLIATASVAAFVGAAHALAALGVPGRLRILGTPAEEGGGGKVVLIYNGAFDPPADVAAAIMAHPLPQHVLDTVVGPVAGSGSGCSGLAGFTLLASHKFRVEFRGTAAHTSGEPWSGTNALDAAVTAYSNASVLRQQIRPDERIHTIIEEGGVVANAILDYTSMSWVVRAPTVARSEALLARVKRCIEAAVMVTGCTHHLITSPTYANLRVNETLCKTYVEDMTQMGDKVALHQDKAYTASTDMGNVSHTVPSFHGAFGVPSSLGVALHSLGFAAAVATDEAHEVTIRCAKGMAMLALRVLTDGSIADGARCEFEQPDE